MMPVGTRHTWGYPNYTELPKICHLDAAQQPSGQQQEANLHNLHYQHPNRIACATQASESSDDKLLLKVQTNSLQLPGSAGDLLYVG